MPTATLNKKGRNVQDANIACPKCGNQTRPVTDDDGETLPQCRMCGKRLYKTAAQMGINLPKEGGNPGNQGMTLRIQRSKMPPDSIAYTKSDSGCKEATKFLGSQSHCLTNCPFPAGCVRDRNRE